MKAEQEPKNVVEPSDTVIEMSEIVIEAPEIIAKPVAVDANALAETVRNKKNQKAWLVLQVFSFVCIVLFAFIAMVDVVFGGIATAVSIVLYYYSSFRRRPEGVASKPIYKRLSVYVIAAIIAMFAWEGYQYNTYLSIQAAAESTQQRQQEAEQAAEQAEAELAELKEKIATTKASLKEEQKKLEAAKAELKETQQKQEDAEKAVKTAEQEREEVERSVEAAKQEQEEVERTAAAAKQGQSESSKSSTVLNDRTVYITATGKRYHFNNHCNGGTYYESTLSQALERGLTACQKCTG